MNVSMCTRALAPSALNASVKAVPPLIDTRGGDCLADSSLVLTALA